MFRFIILTVAMLTILVSSVTAQDAENVEQIARINNKWDNAGDVVVVGTLAYVATELSGLQIMDVSNPRHPYVVGFWDDNKSVAMSVFLSGDYAYVADHLGGLYVIDISDPENPYEIGNLDTPGLTEHVFVSGNFAYVAEDRNYIGHVQGGLRIIDISDPENLVETGYFATYFDGYRVCVSGDYAFLALTQGDDGGIIAIDVSDPENPDSVGYYNTYDTSNIVISDTLAFVLGLGWNGNDARYLFVLDISNPENIEEVEVLELENLGSDGLFKLDEFLYSTAGPNDLTIYNVSDPADISVVGRYSRVGWGSSKSIYVADGFAYMAGSDFRILDVSDPSEPYENSLFWDHWEALAVFTQDDIAYVADKDGPLHLIDISTPEHPVEIECPNLPRSSDYEDIFVSGNLAFGGDRDFDIIDITEPENAEIIGQCGINDGINAIDLSGNYAYIVNGLRSMSVIDISDSTNPHRVSELNLHNRGTGIQVVDDFAYISTMERGGVGGGMRVIDISDPENPDSLTAYERPWNSQDIHISGDYAYVTAGWNGARRYMGLHIIDISNHDDIEEVGFYPTQGDAEAVYVSSGYAFITDGLAGLLVIDVSDFDNLGEVGFYDTPGYAQNVFVTDNLIYVADHTNVGIYRFTPNDVNGDAPSLVTNFKLSTPYPNPFNGQFSFDIQLPQADIVNFNLYDITGRQIWSLSDRFGVGVHRRSVDLNLNSAGVYFLQAESSFGKDIQRVVMLK